MKTVKVNKQDLKDILGKNMITHVEDYDLAWEGYRQAVISNAENLLARAKNVNKNNPVQLYIGLEMPENHEEDYVRAIEMCDWEVSEEVELSEGEFRQYVQDKWSWKNVFETSNMLYTGSASPSSVR